jgi:hypothetical protein
MMGALPHPAEARWHAAATPQGGAATAPPADGTLEATYMTTTTAQGADLPLATDEDITCAPDLGPQRQGVGGGGGRGRRGTGKPSHEATEGRPPAQMRPLSVAELTSPQRLLSPAGATAMRGVD